MQISDLDGLKTRCGKVEGKKYIWGTGACGNYIGKFFNDNGIIWNGYYDNYSHVDRSMLNNKPIFSGQEIDLSPNCIYILSMRIYNAVKKQLLSAGINDNNILFFDNVNVFSALDEIYNDNEKYSNQIKTFEGKHTGKRCFIIGNGPSLKLEDLNTIHKNNEISMASNLIFRCYNKTDWRPDYYFFVDLNGIYEYLDGKQTLEVVSKNCKYMFSRSNGGLKEYMDVVANLRLFRQVYSKSDELFDFSSDCSDRLYAGYTVTYVMLQMAVYMGFTEIYLIGMDHNFSHEMKSDGTIVENIGIKDHFDLLQGQQVTYYNIDKTTLAFISAQKYAIKHNVKIYNATRGGKLEVFERVNFDSLF